MRRILLSAITAMSLASTAMAGDVSIKTAQGDVTLPAGPKTVAVFDIAAVDTLTALGVTLAGIPDKLYVSNLGDLKAKTVGTLFEPDLEALANLNPDLIVVGGRSATQRDSLSQISPTIDMTMGEDVLDHAMGRLDAYATLFGKEAEAEAMHATFKDKLAGLAKAGQDKGNVLVVMTSGSKMALYGPGSRFGWLYDATGMAAAVEDLNSDANHGNGVSPEFIAKANPDWMFVIDRGAAIGDDGQSAEATLKTPLIEGTTAWKNGQVVYLPSASLYIASGGYSATTEVIDVLTKALSK